MTMPTMTVSTHNGTQVGKTQRLRLLFVSMIYGIPSVPSGGVDLPTLKELMGHSQISITMRYVHPTPQHKVEAVNKLQRYNAEQLIAIYEPKGQSPQKVPT